MLLKFLAFRRSNLESNSMKLKYDCLGIQSVDGGYKDMCTTTKPSFHTVYLDRVVIVEQ